MAIEVTPPFKEFTDLSGAPLDNGYIYIGTENLNPEVNLINIYWDESFTTPAANPVRTIAGYPSRNGSPERIFTKAPFSITVKDKNSQLVYSSLSSNNIVQNTTVGTIAALRTTVYAGQPFVSVTGYYTAADNIGVREYYWDSVSTESDNGGTIIQVSGVVTGRWKMKYSGAVNVKWFGVDATGIVPCTTVLQNFINSTDGIELHFPAGDYLCNLMVDGKQGYVLSGVSQSSDGGTKGTRLISDNPLIPLIQIGNTLGAYGNRVEKMALDSKFDKTYSHTGTGLYIKAYSPNVAWRCSFTDLFIRGFDSGVYLDCDINASEIFNNKFENIETVGCNTYGFKTRGVYNYYSKLFSTQIQKYGLYNDGSNSIFNSVITSGMQVYKGGGQHIVNAVIESIDSIVDWSTLPAFEINGTTSTFRGVRLNGVDNAKHPIGISIFGINQTIENVVVQGTSPNQHVLINGGSSGTYNSHSGISTVKVNDALASDWVFNGDVSGITDFWRVPKTKIGSWTPILTRTSSAVTYNIQQGQYSRIGRIVTVSCRINIASVTTQGTGLWTITGLPYNCASGVIMSGVISECGLFSATSVNISPATTYLNIQNAGVYVSGAVGTGNLFMTITYETTDAF